MIHKYKLNGFNIVLDVNSGGVHVVDELTYDLLDNVEPPFDEKCPEKVINKLSKSYSREVSSPAIRNLKNFMMRRSSFPRTITRSLQSIPLLHR